MKLQTTSAALSSISVQAGSFTNPPTTLSISGVQAYLVDSSGNSKAVAQTAILSGFTPARITLASLTPSSLTVGASGLTLTASFQLQNAFKSGYQIQMLFPLWNPSSAAPSHMLSTASPKCIGVINMQASLTCSYDMTKMILTITNAVASDDLGGATMSFSVDNFQNPYNGFDKGGFQITTFESTGLGMVDQTAQLTVTATVFAVIDSPTLVRADAITTVGEQS